MGPYEDDPEGGHARELHHVDGGHDKTNSLEPSRGHPREELVRLALNYRKCDLNLHFFLLCFIYVSSLH